MLSGAFVFLLSILSEGVQLILPSFCLCPRKSSCVLSGDNLTVFPFGCILTCLLMTFSLPPEPTPSLAWRVFLVNCNSQACAPSRFSFTLVQLTPWLFPAVCFPLSVIADCLSRWNPLPLSTFLPPTLCLLWSCLNITGDGLDLLVANEL